MKIRYVCISVLSKSIVVLKISRYGGRSRPLFLGGGEGTLKRENCVRQIPVVDPKNQGTAYGVATNRTKNRRGNNAKSSFTNVLFVVYRYSYDCVTIIFIIEDD